jgi:hypothetical protein
MRLNQPISKQLNGGLGSECIQVTVRPDSGHLQIGWIPVEPEKPHEYMCCNEAMEIVSMYTIRLVTTFFCLGRGKPEEVLFRLSCDCIPRYVSIWGKHLGEHGYNQPKYARIQWNLLLRFEIQAIIWRGVRR